MENIIDSVYSIWLLPEEDQFEFYQGIIQRLARQFGTPAFLPHLTLLGSQEGTETEVLQRFVEIANRLEPVPVKLTQYGIQPDYFRCLYLKDEKGNSIVKSNSLARNIFGLDEDSDYMPHLSLLYGEFEDSIKKDMINGIQEKVFREFYCDRLQIWKTSGSLNQWKLISEERLQRQTEI